MTRPDSGSQIAPDLIEIRARNYRATVSVAGAALTRLTCDGRPLVLDTTAAHRAGELPMPLYSGAVLAPWPNRIRDGRYVYDGVGHALPISEPARGCALHGLVLWHDWTVTSRTDSAVTLRTAIRPQPGYPFHVEVEVQYLLDADGLRIGIAATNLGDTTAPFGASVHPYVVPGTAGGSMDTWTLTAPMATVVTVDPDRLLPLATSPVAGTRFDLRGPTSLDGLALDHAFGAATARTAILTGPDGFGTAVGWDARCPWLQLCTIDEAPGRWARSGLAVEPMTCPPDAFNSGTDVWQLTPGQVRELGITLCAVMPSLSGLLPLRNPPCPEKQRE